MPVDTLPSTCTDVGKEGERGRGGREGRREGGRVGGRKR